tara:strand:+ start:855 stop:1745 length:891 start_codon:yes stop_codon:yes gene_type:complete
MKRYVFIGSVEYSAYCLKTLLGMNINIVEIMCPCKDNSKANSDYSDLSAVAREYDKEVYYFKRIKDETEHIKRNRPDIIFVLGLSQLIPSHILAIPTIGCIGSHPALLPKNRGRHPIIWAIVNGLKKSGITLFWIDEGVDSGDIWDQREFDINDSDDAFSVYEKVKRLSAEMLRENISNLENGEINRFEQDSEKANYWRKRTLEDGQIDWRMSSKRIYDLVRALTKPYVGAHCMYKNKGIKIWKANILRESEGYENIEPGKVVSVENNSIIITTGDGLIKIIDHEFERCPDVGEYL